MPGADRPLCASGLRVSDQTRSPMLRRPAPEEIDSFPAEAAGPGGDVACAREAGAEGGYCLDWLKVGISCLQGPQGRFGRCPGCVPASPVARLRQPDRDWQDLTRSLGYETGLSLTSLAHDLGCGQRFRWLNCGVPSMAPDWKKLQSSEGSRADSLVYVNTVAARAAVSAGAAAGLCQGLDEDGGLPVGAAAVGHAQRRSNPLRHGHTGGGVSKGAGRARHPVAASAFADYREVWTWAAATRICMRTAARDIFHKSVPAQGRDPGSGGRGLRYRQNHGGCFLPLDGHPRSRPDPRRCGELPHFRPPFAARGYPACPKEELALGMLDRIGRAVLRKDDDPFPRLVTHEICWTSTSWNWSSV